MNRLYITQTLVLLFFGASITPAELDTAGKVRFLLDQPPEETWLSKEQFERLKQQSELLQNMPESDQAYEFKNVSKKNLHILATLAAIDTKAYLPKQKIISLLYTRNQDETRTGLLSLDKTLLTPEESGCVESIDLPTLVGIMHDADYLLMDRIVTKSIHAFALYINRHEAALYALLNQEFDSIGLTADLKQRIVTFLIHVFTSGYTRTDDVFASGYTHAPHSNPQASLSESAKMVAYRDTNHDNTNPNNAVVVSHTISNGLTYIGIYNQHIGVFDKTEKNLAIQQNDGRVFLIPINQGRHSCTYLGNVPLLTAIAFDSTGMHIYLLLSHSVQAIDLQTKQRNEVITIPGGYVAECMSRYADVITFANRKQRAGIIYVRETGEMIPVAGIPSSCDTLGRFVYLCDCRYYDIVKRKQKKMRSTIPFNPVYGATFDTESRYILIDTRSTANNASFPIYLIFSIDSGTMTHAINPRSTEIRFSTATPLNLTDNILSIYDIHEQKIKSIKLDDVRKRYLGISLEGWVLKHLMKIKDRDWLYMNYKHIYDTLPKAVIREVPIDVTTQSQHLFKMICYRLQGKSGSEIKK